MTIGSPTRERTRRRSSIQNSGIATASAEANTSYRYRPSNRSASWIRNQEASSPFVSTIPNSTPARKYTGSRRSRARATGVTGAVVVTGSPCEQQRQQEVARQRSGREEGDHRDQGRKLEIGQSRDPVTRGTTAGVRRAEPDEKAAAHDQQPSLEGEQRAPVEQLVGDEPAEVVNAEACEIGMRPGGDGHGLGAREQHAADEPARHDAAREHQVPQAGPRPVVFEERDVPRQRGGAEVAEIARHAQLLVADHEQAGGDEPEERPGHVPGPGAMQQLEHTGNLH